MTLRVREEGRKVPVESGEKIDQERELLVEAIGGLQYKQKLLEVKAGEALALRFNNTDVMPHNLVIVASVTGSPISGMMTSVAITDSVRGPDQMWIGCPTAA